MSHYKQQVATRISYLSDLVQNNLGHFIPPPRVRYVNRGTNAGSANDLTWTLSFNRTLLVDNQAHFIENTVAHEYAHLVVNHLHGIQQFPHGQKWQRLMKMFGVEPRVTHDYDVSKLLSQARVWLCNCQSHYVSLHVARELRKGAQYACDNCGGLIHQ